MKKRILLIIMSWIVEVFTFVRWNNCWHFKDSFYFSKDTLANVLANAINSDTNTPIFLVRLTHNKINTFSWGILQTFLQYWDIRFLSEILGILGAIGVYLALWYLFTKKQKAWWAWVLIAIYSIFALIEMVFIPHFPYIFHVAGFALISQILSLSGLWLFMQGKNKHRIWVVVILLIISALPLWLSPNSYLSVCLHI